MSEQAKGTVQFVKENDYGFYSVKVDGEWYGTGSKKDPGVKKGDKVSFNFYMKDDKWATLKGSFKKLGKGSSSSEGSSGASSGGTSENYWADKTKYEQDVLAPRYVRQFAVREANAFIENAIAAGTLAALLKGKDSLDSLKGLFFDLATELEARANGPKPVAAKAAKAKVEEEEVEEEQEDSDESDEDESEELDE